MTEPAHVQGNERQGYAFFEEDSRGDLVDITFLCVGCAEAKRLTGYDHWPCFDFSPDYHSCCEICGTTINRLATVVAVSGHHR